MLERTANFQMNIAQAGDALELLHSLPDASAAMAWFDPQHRSVLDHQQYGNEGRGRQQARIALPAMSNSYIDTCCREIARLLPVFGYLMLWTDTYRLGEAHHLRIKDVLQLTNIISWDSGRIGNGYRVRECGGYLLVLQKPKITRTGKGELSAKSWIDHGIRAVWDERIIHPRSQHPHIKPIGLITRLINAVTKPGDLIVDPAAGSFVVMRAALELGRNFVGCDLIVPERRATLWEAAATRSDISELRSPPLPVCARIDDGWPDLPEFLRRAAS